MSGRINRMGRLTKSVPGRVISKFLADQAPNWAALIAWNALLALFPIVLFAASLLGYALRLFGEANDAVYKTIFSVIPNDSGQQTEIIKAVSGVKSQSGLLFIVGLVGIAVATSSLLPALKQIPNIPPVLYSGVAAFILQVLVGIIAGFLLFGTMYYVIPNRKQEFRKVVPGALVSGILFELITLVFPLYISLNRGLNQYGATFGLLFVLTTFLFFLGLVTMLGIEVNSVLYPEEARPPATGEIAFAPKRADE